MDNIATPLIIDLDETWQQHESYARGYHTEINQMQKCIPVSQSRPLFLVTKDPWDQIEQILEAAVGWKFLFAIILLLLQKPLTDSKKLQGVKKELECNVRNTRNKNELFKIKTFSVEVFFSALSTVNVFTRQSSHSEIQKVVGCRERSAVNCPF